MEDTLRTLYQPKASLFENNDEYREDILKKTQPAYFSNASQMLAIQKSVGLMETYAANENIAYDVCLLYRYDVMLWDNLLLKSCDISSHVYTTGAFFSVIGMTGDLVMVFHPNQARFFREWYDSLDASPCVNMHTWICRQAKQKEIPIKELLLTNYSIEVLRRVHPYVLMQQKRKGWYRIANEDIARASTHTYFIESTLIVIGILTWILGFRYQHSLRSLATYLTLFFIEYFTLGILLHFYYPYYLVIPILCLVAVGQWMVQPSMHVS